MMTSDVTFEDFHDYFKEVVLVYNTDKKLKLCLEIMSDLKGKDFQILYVLYHYDFEVCCSPNFQLILEQYNLR